MYNIFIYVVVLCSGDGMQTSISIPRVAEEANVVENKAFELPPDYCGSCYGAEEKEGDCCNTCDQVVAKYSLKGWATKDIRRDSEQCKRDAANPLAGVGADEGCNLSGFMLVNKVLRDRWSEEVWSEEVFAGLSQSAIVTRMALTSVCK